MKQEARHSAPLPVRLRRVLYNPRLRLLMERDAPASERCCGTRVIGSTRLVIVRHGSRCSIPDLHAERIGAAVDLTVNGGEQDAIAARSVDRAHPLVLRPA